MEEPGRLQSVGSQRVRHDWAASLLPSLTATMYSSNTRTDVTTYALLKLQDENICRWSIREQWGLENIKGKMSALYFLMIFSSLANILKLLLFLCGSIPFQHVKESQMSKPIPAQAIRVPKLWGNVRLRGRSRSLTCPHERLSWLSLQGPYSLTLPCWYMSFPRLLSGTQWWKVCHQSEWAASQASSSSSGPVMQLNKGEATFIRSFT